ncbi:hypothetical protein FACS1894106_5650 [Spirochaetia bacterium]|nr:hypothetical protein FACS1894106_5650 [Spirochaetia bacterium]
MSDIVVSVGKSAWHSIFHNHAEHREIALKIDNLEKKLEKTIEDLEPTISALKKYLKDKNYL